MPGEVVPLLAAFGVPATQRMRRLDDQKKGGDLPPFFWCDFGNRLVHAYFNLSRFGFLHLRYAYLEDAVFVGGFDAVLLRGLGQGE